MPILTTGTIIVLYTIANTILHVLHCFTAREVAELPQQQILHDVVNDYRYRTVSV